MKNFKTLFVTGLLLLSLSILSCNDDIGTDPCLTGTVRFTNTSNNPYNLSIDGVFKFQLNGNSFRELDLSEGQHQAKVEQVSGYILFPTVKETTLNVFGCQETEWVFP